MAVKRKPDGYSTVSPYLIVEDVDPTITFLDRTFGAEELARYEDEQGGVLHAEVRIDDSVLMMGEATGDWTAIPAMLHVYVDDVDATYQLALEAGGTSLQEPQRREGETDRRGGVEDPAGNTWWIATREPEE